MENVMPTPHRTTDGGVLHLLFSLARSYSMGGLSADSQIARALYDAQIPGGSGGVAPKSLDEIAAMARQSSGWTQAFKQLKAEGLVEEQTLGQVVARWNNRSGRLAPTAGPEGALQSASWRAPSQTGL
jgi:hypothetical protein